MLRQVSACFDLMARLAAMALMVHTEATVLTEAMVHTAARRTAATAVPDPMAAMVLMAHLVRMADTSCFGCSVPTDIHRLMVVMGRTVATEVTAPMVVPTDHMVLMDHHPTVPTDPMVHLPTDRHPMVTAIATAATAGTATQRQQRLTTMPRTHSLLRAMLFETPHLSLTQQA